MNLTSHAFTAATSPAAAHASRAATDAKPSISVIGLGYVGAVSCACLAHLGFHMTGVDISLDTIEAESNSRHRE